VLALPPPSPTYRVELRKLPVEDATQVLGTLVDWAEEHTTRPFTELLDWTGDANGHPEQSSEKLPALAEVRVLLHLAHHPRYNTSSCTAGSASDSPANFRGHSAHSPQIINHASIILDTHLPSFLASHPSHPLLFRLQAALGPLLAMQTDYRRLRAPVDAALTLVRREKRKRLEEDAKRAIVKGYGKAWQGKHQQNQSGGKGGKDKGRGKDAQALLPDQSVGKWRVEDYVF
jgi:hypothetical protein